MLETRKVDKNKIHKALFVILRPLNRYGTEVEYKTTHGVPIGTVTSDLG